MVFFFLHVNISLDSLSVLLTMCRPCDFNFTCDQLNHPFPSYILYVFVLLNVTFNGFFLTCCINFTWKSFPFILILDVILLWLSHSFLFTCDALEWLVYFHMIPSWFIYLPMWYFHMVYLYNMKAVWFYFPKGHILSWCI